MIKRRPLRPGLRLLQKQQFALQNCNTAQQISNLARPMLFRGQINVSVRTKPKHRAHQAVAGSDRVSFQDSACTSRSASSTV